MPAKYKVTTDGGTFEVTTDEPDAIPGAPGGAPAPPKPTLPAKLANGSEVPNFQQPSVLSRAASNLPGSLIRSVTPHPSMGGGDMVPTDSNGNVTMTPPMDSLRATAHAIMNPVDTVKGMFADDPVGTTAAVGNAARMAPKALEAAPSVAAVAKGAAKGGWDGAMAPSTLKVRGIPIQVPVPASISSGTVGYEVGQHMPFIGGPAAGAAGAVIGAGVPAVRGAFKGGMQAYRDLPQGGPGIVPPTRSALSPSSIFNMPGAADTSGPTGKGPTILQREPMPESRQIPASRTIVPPPPEDASGVIPNWKPTTLEREPSPVNTEGVARGNVTQIGDRAAALKKAFPWESSEQISRRVAGIPKEPSVSLPAKDAEQVIQHVEHPPFAPRAAFPASKRAREAARVKELVGEK